MASAQEQEPWALYIALNNDFLASNTVKDDFYTFGLRLEAAQGDISYRFEENAFTDRLAGERFDETFLTIGRLLPADTFGNWCIWVEGGVAHIGEGLLGQGAQNTLHDLTGDDPVFLDYLEGVDEYRLHLRTEIGQQWHINPRWTWGPQFGFSWSEGLRWNAMAGLRTTWRPTSNFGLDIIVGHRYSDTEIDLLKPHLEKESLAAQVNFDLPYGFLIEWSLNRYGTERQHVSLGYHLGFGESPSRHGAWNQAQSTP